MFLVITRLCGRDFGTPGVLNTLDTTGEGERGVHSRKLALRRQMDAGVFVEEAGVSFLLQGKHGDATGVQGFDDTLPLLPNSLHSDICEALSLKNQSSSIGPKSLAVCDTKASNRDWCPSSSSYMWNRGWFRTSSWLMSAEDTRIYMGDDC